MRKFLIGTGQVILFYIFWLIGDYIVTALNWKIPGAFVAIAIVFALLHFRVLKLEWLELGSQWLIGEMLIFFIPAAIGIVNYGELVRSYGLQFIIIIVLSTIIVMGITGKITELLVKYRGGMNS
ncbi:CidA/LrgA family holin-like protein [Paenibacillus sp. N1-5-1-14]|uniref:CidA/LrgA family protein n=1 Tax=Paenibacillus radicibacter TaxID=2972488 RepID=UPI002158B614|nr:CidA/LrgA family holin-like protein [Paenibacillus radicibacter]MCR8641335.1 CidA/LrgA family holin-like protein [Paenibacillus radicibacter]